MISAINSIGRVEGMDEFEHLVSELQQGAGWSIFAMIGYLFLVVWCFLFLVKSKSEIKLKFQSDLYLLRSFIMQLSISQIPYNQKIDGIRYIEEIVP